ncbi:MAG TPA: hypothetical protein VHG91_00740 [Longimicrobium sp.]|nr:hypothetical protein [Longimicrobium sp.]
MPPPKTPDLDPSALISSAIDAAAEASERYVAARTELLHRLAEIDGAVVDLVQRVYDAMPAEYQRTFLVHEAGDDEELPLPDFFRWCMERPGGTRATVTIAVTDNLYDDADDEDAEEDEDDDE